MKSFVEVLDKSPYSLLLGWNPEAVTGISGYNLYVSQVPSTGSMVLVVSNIAPSPSTEPGSNKKVVVSLSSSDVVKVLGLPATLNFSNLILYFTITYIDSNLVESSISDSLIIEVPPVGVLSRVMNEDPTTNRHIYGFSDELQKWTKIASSSNGAIITDACNFYRTNTITEFTRDSKGNVLSEKIYFSDRTTAGSPAKLIVYEYSGDYVSKVIVTDSTV